MRHNLFARIVIKTRIPKVSTNLKPIEFLTNPVFENFRPRFELENILQSRSMKIDI